ncbi:MAG: ExbD/TolR family protein [Kiritimatiellia bacterium]|jgi:biopolymer transport protein ExbD
MSRRRRTGSSEGAELDMTAMIDVVFQLIIFFVVTMTMTKEYNRDIELEDGKHGPTIKQDQSPTTLIIELDRKGRLSINNAKMSYKQLDDILQYRYNRHGQFPVLIRADRRTEHSHVSYLMNRCAARGLWKIGFVAIKEKASKD